MGGSFGKKKSKIIIVGLDNSGKSTMINMLKPKKVSWGFMSLHNCSNHKKVSGMKNIPLTTEAIERNKFFSFSPSWNYLVSLVCGGWNSSDSRFQDRDFQQKQDRFHCFWHVWSVQIPIVMGAILRRGGGNYLCYRLSRPLKNQGCAKWAWKSDWPSMYALH